MHKGAPAFVMRRRLMLNAIMTKPVKLTMFMPNRISLVNIVLSATLLWPRR
jgi:hypothetical protein